MKKFVTGAAVIAALGFVTSANAADMPVKASMVAPAYNWTGFYLGLNAGGGWSNVDQPWGWIGSPATTPQANANGRGFIGGIHGGYNLQSGNFVYGIELDASLTDIKGDDGGSGGHVNGFNAKFMSTARARAGITITPAALLYATGGAAYLRGEGTAPFTGGVRNDHWGWTVGGGLDYALTRNWSARAEYLYASFGRVNYTFPIEGYVEAIRPTIQVVRAGITYKFGP